MHNGAYKSYFDRESQFACVINEAKRESYRGAEMIHQLRIYEIFEQNKAAFHDRFRDHAARIMKSYGFDIIATWESKRMTAQSSYICWRGPTSGRCFELGDSSGPSKNGRRSRSLRILSMVT